MKKEYKWIKMTKLKPGNTFIFCSAGPQLCIFISKKEYFCFDGNRLYDNGENMIDIPCRIIKAKLVIKE